MKLNYGGEEPFPPSQSLKLRGGSAIKRLLQPSRQTEVFDAKAVQEAH